MAAPDVETPAAPANGRAREPEKLVLPAEAVQILLELGLRTEVGAAAWRFFVLAHGEPSWLTPPPGERPRWTFRPLPAEVVPLRPQTAQE